MNRLVNKTDFCLDVRNVITTLEREVVLFE